MGKKSSAKDPKSLTMQAQFTGKSLTMAGPFVSTESIEMGLNGPPVVTNQAKTSSPPPPPKKK